MVEFRGIMPMRRSHIAGDTGSVLSGIRRRNKSAIQVNCHG
jgi:hypothetical protein